MITETTIAGVRPSRPQQRGLQPVLEEHLHNGFVTNVAAPETGALQKLIRHCAAVRARRRRRGFGGPIPITVTT